MENTQREVVSILLQHIFSLGLISQSVYLKAEDLVHSGIDFPELLPVPACLTEEASVHEYSQDP